MNNNTGTPSKPESFAVDHLTMPAPQVRPAGMSKGPAGDVVSKFDLRFLKPNAGAMPTAAVHTLEHLLATYMREHLDNIIDISPMGCRTGFYLSVWGMAQPQTIQHALLASLRQIMETTEADVPGLSAAECGNYRDHSLFAAREYAKLVLDGFGVS